MEPTMSIITPGVNFDKMLVKTDPSLCLKRRPVVSVHLFHSRICPFCAVCSEIRGVNVEIDGNFRHGEQGGDNNGFLFFPLIFTTHILIFEVQRLFNGHAFCLLL